MDRVAWVAAISPTAAMASPLTATSAVNAGAPVPSRTVPPRNTRSKTGAASTRPGRQADKATRAVPPSVRKRRRVFLPMALPLIPSLSRFPNFYHDLTLVPH